MQRGSRCNNRSPGDSVAREWPPSLNPHPNIRYNRSRMPTRLIELIENLPRSRVVLVGDLMLDRYIYANAERLSPEAPVPVLHYQSEELRLGGAGSVAANLAALNAQVRIIGALGEGDADGATVRSLLQRCGADISGIHN